MMGSFLSRALMMVFGYAYPAYECFKTVEKNKPDIEELLFWCHYWILVAMLTVCERVGDTLISWLPMYSEAKLAFFTYLWYSKTEGTAYVYKSFFRPILAKHETEIDHKLLELRIRARQIAVLYWQKVSSYGQTRFFEILQYFSSQSAASLPHSNQVSIDKEKYMLAVTKEQLIKVLTSVLVKSLGGCVKYSLGGCVKYLSSSPDFRKKSGLPHLVQEQNEDPVFGFAWCLGNVL